VQAEQLLARACENESDNAKRMRMGLEPVSQPMPVYAAPQPNLLNVLASCNPMTTLAPNPNLFPNMSALNPVGGDKQLKTEFKPEQLASLLQAAASQPLPVMMTSTSGSMSSPQMTATLAPGLPQTPILPQTFAGLNGATLYRPPFQPAPAFPQSAAVVQQQQPEAQNGSKLFIESFQ
jgi:hypothetical protein